MIVLCQLLKFKYSEDKTDGLQAVRFCAWHRGGLLEVEGGRDPRPKQAWQSEKLVNSLNDVLAVASLSRKAYLSMMGRLRYTDSHVLGRTGKLLMSEIRAWAAACSSDVLRFDDVASESLRMFVGRLRAAAPRRYTVDRRATGAFWREQRKLLFLKVVFISIKTLLRLWDECNHLDISAILCGSVRVGGRGPPLVQQSLKGGVVVVPGAGRAMCVGPEAISLRSSRREQWALKQCQT